jgi:predicted O-methyltransferase YrrM
MKQPEVLITDPAIEHYLMSLSSEDDEQVLIMESHARKHDFPIVDRLVGRLLFLIAKLKTPGLVVELGSGFGYSAYWFAKALEKGKVILTDKNQSNIDYAREIFQKTGLIERAELRRGDAVEIALEYSSIDVLFIDIEKYEYLDAIRSLLPNLNKRALVIADNTLWYGKVLWKTDDRETKGIQQFNEFMFGLENFFTTILPLRDGVLVSMKLN